MPKKLNSAIRDRILQTAIAIFSCEDFHDATMREISEKSGISLANIYNYFASKEKILYTIINEKLTQIISDLQHHLVGIKGTENKLRKFTWYYLNFCEKNMDFSRVSHINANIKFWSESRDSWEKALDIARLFNRIIIDGQIIGDVREGIDLELAGNLYFGGIRGTIILWFDNNQKYRLTDKADRLSDMIWQIVKQPESSVVKFYCPLLNSPKILKMIETEAISLNKNSYKSNKANSRDRKKSSQYKKVV